MEEEYTLPDGRVFPAKSEIVRIDKEVRAAHIAAMNRLDTEGRRAYLQRVERSEGKESLERLKAEYLKQWEARKNR